VIIITGPTAVGKTGVGLDVALALDGEVISADSVQVYRGLDIGSDKVCMYACIQLHVYGAVQLEKTCARKCLFFACVCGFWLKINRC